jgi:hypothetical protein
MRVIAFDQSLTASAAVVLDDDESYRLRIVDEQFYRPKSSGIYRLAAFKSWATDLIASHNADLMVRELHNQIQYGAANQLQVAGGLLDMAAYNEGYLKHNRYVLLPVTTWKKFITGKGNLKKDTAYLMHINKAIESHKLFKPANNFELLDDNLADAICLGITGYALKMIASGIDLPIGEQSKKNLEKSLQVVFDYGKLPK